MKNCVKEIHDTNSLEKIVVELADETKLVFSISSSHNENCVNMIVKHIKNGKAIKEFKLVDVNSEGLNW
jgi:hypothetical protein